MFGYVPPVPRAPMPVVRAHSGVVAPAWRELVAPGARKATMRRVRRGLILDLDDTLYPRERFVRSGLAAVAHHVSIAHGVPSDLAFGAMMRSLAADGNGSELQALCRRFDLPHDIIPGLIEIIRMHTPSLFLSEDVTAALRRLRAEGWGLAILTNGLPSVQFRKVAALGLTSLVDEIIYAEEHAAGGKPSGAPFEAALRSLELSAGQCVCAGDDAARDMRGAKSLGVRTVRIARPGATVQPDDEADVVIGDLRQLPEAASLLVTMVPGDVA
jgi:putative hydrolase of the HAD superfamily